VVISIPAIIYPFLNFMNIVDFNNISPPLTSIRGQT